MNPQLKKHLEEHFSKEQLEALQMKYGPPGPLPPVKTVTTEEKAAMKVLLDAWDPPTNRPTRNSPNLQIPTLLQKTNAPCS